METPEEFRDIPGYEGIYQVSNKGRVKSLERIILRRDGSKQPKKELILAPGTNRRGYYHVGLSKNSKIKYLFAHRLVLLAFVGPPPTDTHECLHNDDNPKNNNLSNLKWGSSQENSLQCFHKNRSKGTFQIGQKCHKARKVIQFDETGLHILEVFNTMQEAGEKVGVDGKTISRCCKGRPSFKTKSKWKYYEDYFTVAV